MANRLFRAKRLMMCAALALVGAGCSDGLPERVPVAGYVVIDGQPLTTGAVMLAPEGQRASIGAIGPDGRFELSCYERGDGAVLGTHKVSVTASEQIDERSSRWHAPKKYAHVSTSGLTATIEGPTDDLKIELSWDGGQPFVERN